MLDKFFVEHMPGVAGDVARYIDSQMKVCSPQFSIPTALALVATIKAKSWKSDFCRSPCVYVCSIDEAGKGKTTAQEIANDLLVDSGNEDLIIGIPGTHQALSAALMRGATRLMVWDEFGLAISELSRSRESNRAGILSLIMRIFSANGSRKFIGTEYKTEDRADIENPNLTLLGGSTPSRFFSSLSQDFVEDGFLPRVLLFTPPEKRERPAESKYDRDGILEILSGISRERCETAGQVWESIVRGGARLQTAAKDRLIVISADYDFLVEAAHLPMERIFWRRGFEQFSKILSIVSDGAEVTLDEIDYARTLTDTIIKNAIAICKTNLFSSQKEKVKEKFASCIKSGESLTTQQITRRTWRLDLSRSERAALVADLVESGTWIEHRHEPATGERRRAFSTYRLGDK